MFQFDASVIAKDCNGQWVGGYMPDQISGFCYDSRKVMPGDVFVALKTDFRDGHDYIANAKEAGAVAAVVQNANPAIGFPQLQVKDSLKAYQEIAYKHRMRFGGKVVGITGSCGKTTTKDLTSHLLGQDVTCSNYLNENNLIGVPFTLLKIHEKKHQYAVIEAGTNMLGEMEVLASMIKPDICILTNIYPVHLAGFKNLKTIAKEKAALAIAASDKVILPLACMNYRSFRSLGKQAWVLVNEEDVDQTAFVQKIIYAVKGLEGERIELVIQLPGHLQKKRFVLPLLSSGMLSNVALSITACLRLGLDEQTIQTRLATWAPSEHRGQVYRDGKCFYYADCYNANPVSMIDALDIFQKRFGKSKQFLYILGSMGELGPDAPKFHFEVGQSLKLTECDKVLLIGDNAQAYEKGLLSAGNKKTQIFCLNKREEAFDYLSGFEGIVFLKGSNRYELWELLPKHAKLEEF